MTKLTEIGGVTNAQPFVSDEIIEQKGPYVEFVDAPKFHEQSAKEFLSALDYHDQIIEAIVTEVFGGDEGGSLYQHQAETINAIHRDSNDNILAVPTATGKTESFFLPILNHCLSTEESGLKSIVVYPMKTLGVDQLNRFISYLDHINRHRTPSERITIGIWDSDTPTRVGTRDYEIEVGSYVRGLECPREDDEKLRILGQMSVGTDDHQYPWIRVTRDSIRQGVDILLTGPEALDYMFVSDNDETRGLLGSRPGEMPVEHIVFDEAHVWSGIQGAAVSLLSERLKSFYADRDPQITMVSATVDNPAELAADLTRSSESEINSIEFTSRAFTVSGEPDFTRFRPCQLEDLIHTLAIAHVQDVDERTLKQEYGLGNALETLQAVGLLSETDPIELTDIAGTWPTTPIDTAVSQALDDSNGGFDTPAAVVTTERGQSRVVKRVLKASGTRTQWYDFVLDSVPEVATFAEWFEEGTTGAVEFKRYDELQQRVAESGVDNPEGVLEVVMAFGRLAGIVTQKYHGFLKPPQKVYWCRECEQVTRNSLCPDCGAGLPELQFCKNCHQPHVEVPTDDRTDGDAAYAAVGAFATNGNLSSSDTCPGCGDRPRLTDIGVPTSSLLSYMLTEICRASPSKKTLVFSDSRRTAESVGDRIIDTEYGLMAETLYIQELIERGGQADNYELFQSVGEQLREEYWKPLIQNQMDQDGIAYNFLHTLREDIDHHAMLSNCNNLLESAMVTADVVYDVDDVDELLIGHAMYSFFVGNSGVSFTKSRISFDGVTRSKLIDRIERRLGYPRHVIDQYLDDCLRRLLDAGIVGEVAWDEIRQKINSSTQGEDVTNEVFDFIEAARETAIEHDLTDEPESGVFQRTPTADDSELVLLPVVAFCPECYQSFPASAEGESCSQCPDCGETIETYRRFREDETGTLIADPGYAELESGWDYAIDHWAHDITRPIADGKQPEFISVGIHKGNIPHTLRGAIEEGFRKDDPDVNIVSATPTMELGVDIGTLDTVAQVGIPPTLTNYVQRSGRTGRTRGSSSLVVTAVRGDHPVDTHYYANLDAFLDDFEPVRVPDPYQFDELLAGHVVAETFAYLARNPHEENVFERMYTLKERKQNLLNFVDSVEKQLDILREFTLAERRDSITSHLRDIFGEDGVRVFEAVFEGSGPLSLDNRVEKTFSKLATMAGEAEMNKAFTEENRRLDQWLQRLGYLANYRSFGQQFPVKFRGASEGIEFESGGRLYDMFPGEENDLGSVMTLHGTDYIVDDVHGTGTSLTTVGVCDNEECERPFQSSQPGVTTCPHCEENLEETPIHGISSIECKAARGGQKGYTTRGLQSTYIEEVPDEQAVSETQTQSLFGLSCDVTYGQLEVTDFVYAFERWHSQSSDKEVLRSQAVIERDGSSSETGGSWRDRMDDVESEVYRPVGQQYFTQGLTLRFDQADVRDRYEQATHEPVSWPQALVSLEQALEKSVAIVAECDQSDFRVKTVTTDEEVLVYIVDSRQGGNGISWQVFDQLDAVEQRVWEVTDCDRCEDYCDECLLLARTPAYYLENNLLNRRTLATITQPQS
jgi:superfamily II DNA/RNA helicase/rubrerythrin